MQSHQMNEKLRGLQEQTAKTGMSGAATIGRPGLRDRVRDQLSRASQEASRASRLDELETLLDKHPDVARILDLVEDLRG